MTRSPIIIGALTALALTVGGGLAYAEVVSVPASVGEVYKAPAPQAESSSPVVTEAPAPSAGTPDAPEAAVAQIAPESAPAGAPSSPAPVSAAGDEGTGPQGGAETPSRANVQVAPGREIARDRQRIEIRDGQEVVTATDGVEHTPTLRNPPPVQRAPVPDPGPTPAELDAQHQALREATKKAEEERERLAAEAAANEADEQVSGTLTESPSDTETSTTG